MAQLRFEIRLKAPVLIGQVAAGEENSAQSMEYIPGSVLRGMLVNRYVKKYGEIRFDKADLSYRLFFSGEVQFLHAYPQSKEGNRSLPTPRSWFIDKNDPDPDTAMIYDRGFSAGPASPKSPGFSFCLLNGDQSVTPVKVDQYIGLHNTSSKRFVKQQGDSTVYRYDALAADQSFAGVIITADDGLRNELKDLLSVRNFRVGRSQRAGYGAMQITLDADPQEQAEYEPAKAPSLFSLTLLSDVVLRDGNGQWATSLLEFFSTKGLPAPTAVFQSSGVTGGFNRTWGLPLPQTPMICAGSVYCFDKISDIEAKLQALAQNGIGERKIEGFGRLALNWHASPTLQQKSLLQDSSVDSKLKLEGTGRTLAATIVKRLYQRKLDDALLNKVAALNILAPPENSQLSRLRVVARKAQEDGKWDTVQNFLKELRSTAKPQFEQARIDGQSFTKWLNNGLGKEGIWEKHFATVLADSPKIADTSAAVDEQIKVDTLARLVDAICRKASKQEENS